MNTTACSVALQMSCELMCKQSVFRYFYYYMLMVEYCYPSIYTKRDKFSKKYMHLCCGVVVEFNCRQLHIRVMTLGKLFTHLFCHHSSIVRYWPKNGLVCSYQESNNGPGRKW